MSQSNGATNSSGVAVDRSKPLVLVVEDNPINQVVARATLEQAGMSVIVSGDGLEAVALYEELMPAFVLLDLRMPGLSGFEVAQEIRQLEAARNIPAAPIVAASANLPETAGPACQAAGMNGFLGKPYRAEQLVKVVQHHLGRRGTADGHDASRSA